MRLSPRLTSLPPLAALVLAVAVPAAHAAHHDLNFISSPGAFSASDFDSGGTHYDFYMLVLAVEPTVTLIQGDTVTATFALSLVSGATPVEAAELANRAAGVVVGKIGTAPIHREELEEALNEA